MPSHDELKYEMSKHLGIDGANSVVAYVAALFNNAGSQPQTIPGYAPDGTVVPIPNPDLNPPQPSSNPPLPDPSATQPSPGNSGEGE